MPGPIDQAARPGQRGRRLQSVDVRDDQPDQGHQILARPLAADVRLAGTGVPVQQEAAIERRVLHTKNGPWVRPGGLAEYATPPVGADQFETTVAQPLEPVQYQPLGQLSHGSSRPGAAPPACDGTVRHATRASALASG